MILTVLVFHNFTVAAQMGQYSAPRHGELSCSHIEEVSILLVVCMISLSGMTELGTEGSWLLLYPPEMGCQDGTVNCTA